MRNVLAVLLVLLSAFLLFWRLDGVPLWRDETTTANWGRLMAESGVWIPRVFDGEQLIVQAADGHDVNSHLLPAMQSWLQFYVSAVGFKLLGVSTWSARAPFALLGAATLFVLYRVGVVLFGGGVRPLMLPSIGLLSIYFLYAARSSRYYVLILLAAALLLLEMCRYLREPERAASRAFYLRLGVYGAMLYLSNYVAFAGNVACARRLRLDRGPTAGSCGGSSSCRPSWPSCWASSSASCIGNSPACGRRRSTARSTRSMLRR